LSIEKDPQDNDEDFGKYHQLKLSKFEKHSLSNLSKDVDSFLYMFKLISKLVRSCQYLSESKPEYSDSPFKMDNEEPVGYVAITDVQALVSPNESVLKYLFSQK